MHNSLIAHARRATRSDASRNDVRQRVKFNRIYRNIVAHHNAVKAADALTRLDTFNTSGKTLYTHISPDRFLMP